MFDIANNPIPAALTQRGSHEGAQVCLWSNIPKLLFRFLFAHAAIPNYLVLAPLALALEALELCERPPPLQEGVKGGNVVEQERAPWNGKVFLFMFFLFRSRYFGTFGNVCGGEGPHGAVPI